MRNRGFPAVVGSRPRVLILGSMPGQASLAAREYYAQPRNQFWRVMSAMTGAAPECAYDERLEALTRHGFALWDVIHSCERPGSLDSAIVAASVRVNDFSGFHAAHPTIRLIAFNGATAERLYVRLVLPGLEGRPAAIERCRLPSTSPAHASLSAAAKLHAWARALAPVRK